jgi:hypothetical protein
MEAATRTTFRRSRRKSQGRRPITNVREEEGMKKLAFGIVALGLLGARPAISQEMKMEMAEGKDVEFTAQVVDLSCKVVYNLSLSPRKR